MGETDWTTIAERYGVLGIICAFFLLMTWRCLSWLTKVVIPSLMKDILIPLKDRAIKFFDSLDATHELLKDSAKNTDRALNQIVKDRADDRKVLEDIRDIMNDTWNPPRKGKTTHLRHNDGNERGDE